ncbi:hypothetical protein [Aeromicrobium sp. UC242_57]|uniref:hypothetical protein n=1 Tax=Aeromicrobium sp. UC242_57 TaxID=3374624 RepID=UPI0037910907
MIGLLTLGNTYRDAISTSLVMVMLALSVVIVTGYVGQISLMQMAFAGIAAFVVSKPRSRWGSRSRCRSSSPGSSWSRSASFWACLL